MTIKRFWLKPFVPLPGVHSLDVVGRVSRENNLLTVSYEILGSLQQLISSNKIADQAVDYFDICRSTCLECFVAPPKHAHYWKFELIPTFDWIEDFSQQSDTPSGWDFQVSSNHNWTVSRFDSYHQGEHTDPSIKTISYSMLSTPKALHTLLKIDLEKMLLSDCDLSIGISAITRLSQQNVICWALKHPNNKPDFHNRDGFTLAI